VSREWRYVYLLDRFGIPGWYGRIWPRIKRWWHCLWGTIATSSYTPICEREDHRKVDVTVPCVWFDYPTWIGCACGKTFWQDKNDY